MEIEELSKDQLRDLLISYGLASEIANKFHGK